MEDVKVEWIFSKESNENVENLADSLFRGQSVEDMNAHGRCLCISLTSTLCVFMPKFCFFLYLFLFLLLFLNTQYSAYSSHSPDS